MNLIMLFRNVVNFLYIFSIVNDNFMVEQFGPLSLKIMFVIFFVANFMALFRFNYKTKVNKCFVALIVMLTLSYVFNLRNYSDIQQPLLSILSMLMIFVVASTYRNPKVLLKFFLISVFFSSLICINSDTTLTKYTFRKTGGTGDPNEFSTMLLVSIGYLIGRLRSHSSVIYKFIQIMTVIVYLIALFMAGSKSAILVLAVLALIYFILLLKKRSFKSKVKITLSYIVLFSIVAFIIWNINPEMIVNVLGRFEDNSSAGERFISWAAGFQMWMKSPLVGIGPQNYVNMIAQNYSYIAEASRAAHSIYVQSLVEVGLLGFIPFMVFVTYLIKNSIRGFLQIEYVLGLLCILVMGATLASFYEKYVWLYFGIICNPLIMHKLTPKQN